MKIRRLFCLALLLAGSLSACTLPGFLRPGTDSAKLFAQGIDAYQASNDLTLLQQLANQPVQEAWQTRAAALLALIEELERNQQHSRRQARQQEKHGNLLLSGVEEQLLDCQQQSSTALDAKNAELARCQREKTALGQDVRILEDTLTRLKDVLIHTERQAQ
ncbi:MAG: hypothetical protein GW875_12570 [Deltaproteobacteria bacterium]|nr:hypothetical protein [Deltaproteobacteria bacterium]NCP03022.1 hypothetical protein [Deltaproteobacteria bacterium]